MEKIVVKIIDSHNHHSAIKTFKQSKISIGRGFDNDLIVEDTYVSDHHGELNLIEGKLILTDQSSLNGVIDKKTKKRLHHEVIESGQEIMVGRTTLVFYKSSHRVGLAKSFKKSHWFVRSLNKPWVAVAGLFILSLLVGIEAVTGFYEKQKWLYRISAICITDGIALGWAAGWSFITYLLRRRAYFLLHLGTICFYFSLYYCSKVISAILLFNLGIGVSYLVWEGVAFSSLTLLLLIRTLRVASRMSPVRAAVLSLIFVVVINVCAYPISRAHYVKRVSRVPHYTSEVYTKAFKFMPSKSLEDWFG